MNSMNIKKVLVVDDSPTDRYVLTSLLEGEGYAVETVESGNGALSKIREGQPQLVLLDGAVPGTSGYQIARQLECDPDLKDLPVMMYGAREHGADCVWALCQGVRSYVVKPLDPEELLTKIGAID
ncbi:response regulator [Herbaspirillum sp. WKF16]|uniref:response regulator n=1 Tax=Herbaspirillum sp. WKF16 TaxID=3028312 RepID=UPI0023A9F81A|nr:response regulator [Herbaspirillum sp. WKF16]WDZ95359.1 response regulator [Herbaspirillum sp. WKF16]